MRIHIEIAARFIKINKRLHRVHFSISTEMAAFDVTVNLVIYNSSQQYNLKLKKLHAF